MPDNIPLESQELIRQFKEEEARKAALRKATKPPKEKEAKKLPRGAKSEEVIHFVSSLGFKIQTGGNHSYFLAANGEKCTIPFHGSQHGYANGTLRSIEKFCLRNKP